MWPADFSSPQAAMAKEEEEGDRAKPKYRGWRAMPYVIGNETFEKLGTIGTSANLLVYLTTVFHMKSVSAATLLNVWGGTTNIATLLGAFLCDAYLGRYKTLGVACIASFMGMLLLTLTAAVSKLHPPHCEGAAVVSSCEGATQWQYTFLLAGLGLLVIGAGGIRPCNLAFGADQFDPTTESGKRGINSFFNWYYFTFTIAVMASSTVIIYVQSNVSWALGLGIPAGLMLLSCAFFFVGSPMYVKVRPVRSPFTSVAQVFVAAARKHGVEARGREEIFDPPRQSELVSVLPHTEQFSFLDKAAVVVRRGDEIKPDGSPADPWRLCSLQQVEAVKCLVRVIPIWASGIVFSISTNQQSTYVVFQALQSDRRLIGTGTFLIPAGSFMIFSMLALSLWIPIYDRLVIPWLRRATGRAEGVTLLQRIGAGVAISIAAMSACAATENRRRTQALRASAAVSPMSGLWLVPQLALGGLSEAFALIGLVEFYYREFPEDMRSVAGSLLFFGMAISSYVSGFMVAVVHRATEGGGRDSWLAEDLNKGRLDYYYGVVAGMEAVNLLYFLVCANWYKYKGQLAGESGTTSAELATEKMKKTNHSDRV